MNISFKPFPNFNKCVRLEITHRHCYANFIAPDLTIREYYCFRKNLINGLQFADTAVINYCNIENNVKIIQKPNRQIKSF